ncbi:MAG: antibiotic biosynthesis monooxygenase [Chloroflexi bacterium]|nr:antibiotic biosynthesis monooxygenase [Chloroflexota bacterium]MCH7953104.1 antibiotic biosynthesis monooxygenase [Chloroflexota bacterium]MCI0818448.1 antibiotic biosynthesis monooxygenase [Chloroflexota bacterium]MCI0820337.1 antibiotic biosynthesis monooxygenase [Chloroflexota bacterium]MCI0838866.1 antibiotic biosynthesis monooxygenase [Chloroflexota bacterium]
MFVAMNNFKVNAGREDDFEKQWRERETFLEGVPGFVEFMLLKSDKTGDYISHTTWKDRQSFMDWTQSEAFAKGHRQGSVAGVLEGPPVIGLFEAVLVATA